MNFIELAKQANRYASNQTNDSHDWQIIRDERFAALVRAAALEEAAAVADKTVCDIHLPTGVAIYGNRAGAAIRSLKEET